MDKKTLSVVAYITLIGWVVAYLQNKNNPSEEVRFHLRQSLGIMIFGFALSVVLTIAVMVVPSLGFLNFLNLAVLILWVLGIINAVNSAQREVPLIGRLSENRLTFI